MPPSPEKNGGKRKAKGRASTRPYADTYLIGLRIGLSCEELRSISYPAIVWLIHQYTLMNEPAEKVERKDGARMATDADVRALMFM